jgi:hypothetical protein
MQQVRSASELLAYLLPWGQSCAVDVGVSGSAGLESMISSACSSNTTVDANAGCVALQQMM